MLGSNPRPSSSGPSVWTALLAVVGTRVALVIVLAGWESASPTPPHEDRHCYHYMTPQLDLAGQLFVKWDSYWYLNIVEHGYQAPTEDRPQSNLAFAPLYPALVYVLARVGVAPWLGGVLIALLCYVLLLYYLYQLGCTLQSARLGCLLMIFVSAFPSAWVLHMVYAESMFALFLAAFFTHYLRRQYVRAGICGFLLPMVRIAGIALLPAIAADVGYRLWKEKRLHRGWIALLLSGVGMTCLIWVYLRLAGSPTAFADAGRTWFGLAGVKDRVVPLLSAFVTQWTRMPAAPLFLVLFVIYALTSVIVLRRNKDIGGWFAVVYVIMLLKTPFISAQMRYLLPLFPVHVYWIKRLEEKGGFKAVVVVLLLLQVLLTRMVLTWRVVL